MHSGHVDKGNMSKKKIRDKRKGEGEIIVSVRGREKEIG